MKRLGLGGFLDLRDRDAVGDQDAAQMDVDAAALASHLAQLNGARCTRVRGYIGKEATFSELAVLVPILQTVDVLLYRMMGGADRSEAPCKLEEFVNAETGLIGAQLETLAELMLTWTGDSCRRPWMILDMVSAPLHDEAFISWARGQIMRANSTWVRRYEVKFWSWPYKLHKLTENLDGEAMRQVAQELHDAKRCCLDTFSASFRQMVGPNGRRCAWSDCKGDIGERLRCKSHDH